MSERLKFLPARHPVHSVRAGLVRQLREAQENLLSYRFKTASDLCVRACKDTGVDPRLSEAFQAIELTELHDLGRSELIKRLTPAAERRGISASAVTLVADRTQLLEAFDKPDAVVESIRRKVEQIVSRFPKDARDLECGRNPGDLLDPFITAATQELMFGGSVEGAIEGTTSHKAMMMVEGLIGHLHEDVIGMMRGNVRIPEPRGAEQEQIDPETNPFPGADVMQPPWIEGQRLRFHQIKSKTGSAKGGDGKRLGDQLRILAERYKADVFYDALVGVSLAGHRSKAAVLRAAPMAAVLVGQTAFKELTGSAAGAELVLQVYQQAFRDVARATGYNIRLISVAIAAEFKRKAKDAGEGFLQILLKEVTGGKPEKQDSRLGA